MKDKGNGRPEQCAANLLLITRGEVPYERLKGLDPGMIDRPSSTATSEARADIEWTLRTYEPRISIDSVDFDSLLSEDGQFGLNVGVSIV